MAFEQAVIFTASCHTGWLLRSDLKDYPIQSLCPTSRRYRGPLLLPGSPRDSRYGASRRYRGPILLPGSPRDSRYGASRRYQGPILLPGSPRNSRYEQQLHRRRQSGTSNQWTIKYICLYSKLLTCNGDIFIWVKHSRVGRKNPNKHTNKQTKVADKEKKETRTVDRLF